MFWGGVFDVEFKFRFGADFGMIRRDVFHNNKRMWSFSVPLFEKDIDELFRQGLKSRFV